MSTSLFFVGVDSWLSENDEETLNRYLMKDMPEKSHQNYEKIINPATTGDGSVIFLTDVLMNVLVPDQLCEKLDDLEPERYESLTAEVKKILDGRKPDLGSGKR